MMSVLVDLDVDLNVKNYLLAAIHKAQTLVELAESAEAGSVSDLNTLQDIHVKLFGSDGKGLKPAELLEDIMQHYGKTIINL